MATLPSGYKVVGTDWTAPVTSAKCEWVVQATGDKITIYYRDVWTNGLWRTRIPALSTALGFSASGFFQSATARQIEPGVLCEVQLIFALTAGGGVGTPASTVSENASSQKESITKHPNFNAASGAGTPSDANSPWFHWWDPARKAFINDNVYASPPYAPGADACPSYLVGVTDYEVGSSTVTVLDYFDGEPSDVEPNLGKIATPPAKTAGHYLLISGGKNPTGQFWQRRLVYQFSSLPWPTQIYPAV